MAFIANLGQLVEELTYYLEDYLVSQLGEEYSRKSFKCFVHDDEHPSMGYVNEDRAVVSCRGCGISMNIFGAAEELEGLPRSGRDWVKITVPTLAKRFGIEYETVMASPVEREKAIIKRLLADVADFIRVHGDRSYAEKRGWSTEYIVQGVVDIDKLLDYLAEQGWGSGELEKLSLLGNRSPLGPNRHTVVICDYMGNPVSLTGRAVDGKKPKWIHSPNNVLTHSGELLPGIDIARRLIKHKGLYLVEGVSDVLSLHKIGVLNVAAINGTNLSEEQLKLIKMFSLKQLTLCLDWDEAGQNGIYKNIMKHLAALAGLNVRIVCKPDGDVNDPGDWVSSGDYTAEDFYNLKTVSLFEWLLEYEKSKHPVDIVAKNMIKFIAAEPTAVKRDLLIQELSKATGINADAITSDVEYLIYGIDEKKNSAIVEAVEEFKKKVVTTPVEASSLTLELEEKLDRIYRKYSNNSIGAIQQLNRFDALQELRAHQQETGLAGEFGMNTYNKFQRAFSDGATWTDGVLFYFGGRENSGKTATLIALGLDVLLSDPDSIVVMHFTDDSYAQVEPRLRTNIAYLMYPDNPKPLTIGISNNPNRTDDVDLLDLYQASNDALRDLMAQERLFILDMEDGTTLSAVERALRYIRRRHPTKKLLVIQDNTHNLTDSSHLDPTSRMTMISNHQKLLTGKYHCALFASVEYRKNSPDDYRKLRLPSNDDIADARSLKYRANAIIHVYNDLNDRRDAAEHFWTSRDRPGQKLPRLRLMIGKNKVSSFKGNIWMDLDPLSATLKQASVNQFINGVRHIEEDDEEE